jgi:hypothetical protein
MPGESTTLDPDGSFTDPRKPVLNLILDHSRATLMQVEVERGRQSGGTLSAQRA